MSDKCLDSRCCDFISGKCVLYTGPNITTPLQIDNNTSINEVIVKFAEYLSELSPEMHTVTVTTVPEGATVFINGLERSSITAPVGSELNIEVTMDGYLPASLTHFVGNSDESVQVVLVPAPEEVTVEFISAPPGATISVNGSLTNTFTGVPGTIVVVTATLEGYLPYFSNYILPLSNTIHTLPLTPVPSQAFTYYWGEIGNIFAPNPSDITDDKWVNQIKPNGTGGNMLELYDVGLQNSYELDSTGDMLQWWIMLVPSDKISNLNEYVWYTWDEVADSYLEFTEHPPYEGVVELDGVSYTYSAIRPSASVKIKYEK